MERLTKRVGGMVMIDDSQCSDIMRRAYEKLAEYEDLEEQGLLLKLPCKVGDIVYVIERGRMHPFKIESIDINKYETLLLIAYAGADGNLQYWRIRTHLSNLGSLYFLTKEEAEAALAEMEKNNG